MELKKLIDHIHELGKQKSVLTKAELIEIGATESALNELVKSDILYPSASGIYMPDNADFGEHHTRVEVAARFPDTVICLFTALSFHRLTTQMPEKVWIAYDITSNKPKEPKLPIKPVGICEPNFSQGIETYLIEGITVKVYSIAKTIADCFTWEHLVGIDVAIEAFNQAIVEQRTSITDVLNYIELEKLKPYTRKDLEECISSRVVLN